MDLLIPGRGEPIPGAALVFSGQRIMYAGPAVGSPEVEYTYSAPQGSVMMPGLWDSHVHFTGQKTTAFGELVSLSPAVAALRAAKDAELALEAGVTSVREVGGLGIYLSAAVKEGTLRGPAIYAAGAILSQTGGHGDIHDIPLHWMGEASSTIPDNFRPCDGEAECLKAAREQLRKGADFLKVCTSGGVLSTLDDPLAAQLSPKELATIVEEATRAGRVVAAHAHGKAGIMAAIEAGVLTIEHGSALDDEGAAAMYRKGMILVPTRFAIERLLQVATGSLTDAQVSKLKEVARTHSAAVKAAIAANVTIALGTDIQTSGKDSVLPFGLHGQEGLHLMELGMSALQVIEAATANGPMTLGSRHMPKSGQLKTGFDADFIILDGDPLQNMTVLADVSRVRQVWRLGKKVKDSFSGPYDGAAVPVPVIRL